MVDLSNIPVGWWLFSLEHKHTEIRFRGQVHEPMFWVCKLQRIQGGLLKTAEGETAQEAVDAAIYEAMNPNTYRGDEY